MRDTSFTSPRALFAALAVVLAVPPACDKAEADDKTKVAEADKPKDEAKPKEEAKPKDEAKPAKTNDSAAEIDVDALLEAKDSASGVLASSDLSGIDASAAPRLGGNAHTDPALAQAQWLTMPGGQLESANPPGWAKTGDGKVGLLLSPDQKVALIGTTYTTQDELVKKLDDVGKLAKIAKVDWKEPKQVQLGPDGLPALVRAGKAVVADGSQGGVLFALVETGVPEKVLVIALEENDAPEATQKQAEAVLLSIRKKRG
jgi:hypothetical protein